MTVCGYTVLIFNEVTQANSAWVGTMSTTDGYGYSRATARKENSEFCVTVGPVIRTVGILT